MPSRRHIPLVFSLSLLASCQRPAAGVSAASTEPPTDTAPSGCEAFAAIGRGDLARAEKINGDLGRRQVLALAHGREAIAAAREMRALYPGVVEFFSYYTGEVSNTVWNSTVVLHGRYELTAQVQVTLDASRTRVVAQSEPEFYVGEAARVYIEEGEHKFHVGRDGHVDMPWDDGTTLSRDCLRDPDGRIGISMSGGASFGASEWAVIVRAGGDLSSVLKTPMRADAPVACFAEVTLRELNP
jgi:hypothetical protein